VINKEIMISRLKCLSGVEI